MRSCMLFLILIIALVHGRNWNSPTFVKIRNLDTKPDVQIDDKYFGTFLCNNKPAANLRLHIRTPEHDSDIVTSYTTDTGIFAFVIPQMIPIRGPVTLETRHVCPVDNVPVEEYCAVPYYLTRIPVQWPQKISEYNVHTYTIHLDKGEYNTTAHCL